MLYNALLSIPVNCIAQANPVAITQEKISACVITQNRDTIAQCLGWNSDPTNNICLGNYQDIFLKPLQNAQSFHLVADEVSLYTEGRSELLGHVILRHANNVIHADTAYVYREAKSNAITRIELLHGIRMSEPERVVIARYMTLNPRNNSGQMHDAIYRFGLQRAAANLPAWGMANLIKRYPNNDYLLQHATYTTCSPTDRSWHIDADSIKIENAKQRGIAKNAKLYLGDTPVMYMPYFTFPTAKKRQSGFLAPTTGNSTIGGFDFSMPYYWNIAPQSDATIAPHVYSKRGLMVEGQFRYLTRRSAGEMQGTYLAHDTAYADFINANATQFPVLDGIPTSRWLWGLDNTTNLGQNLDLNITTKQVSDNYYLQDFSTNLAILTDRQLLQQGALTYTTDNWLLRGMLQRYQTVQPITETPVAAVYQRLPQILAQGSYLDFPAGSNLNIVGQFDQFKWPNSLIAQGEGPRLYFNPILSMPRLTTWGYLTPSIELAQNYYAINSSLGDIPSSQISHSIPRYSIDGGIYFDRNLTLFKQNVTQTLEPRIYYLYVPYHNQSQVPTYDSWYMIFDYNQLFRNNRFSGFDRIGDANQLALAVTSRLLTNDSGLEKLSASVGQLLYFENRRVQLCQSNNGQCTDNPFALGYLSPIAKTSPIAARMMYHLNSSWTGMADYIWNTNPATTYNANINLRYQNDDNRLLNIGYTYLTNGNIAQAGTSPIENDPLHQIALAYAWPYNDSWSSLGATSYNISTGYSMMNFLGIEYNSCCWAVRLLGGQAFQKLNNQLKPQYNNNVYVQVLWKGLGSLGNSDPATVIQTFLPGYRDHFH